MTIEQAKIYAKLSDEELNKLGIKAPKTMRAFADGKKIKIKVWDKLEKEYIEFRDNDPDFKGYEKDYIILKAEEEYFSVSFTPNGALAEKSAIPNKIPKFNGNSFPSLEVAQKRADFINWLLFKSDENIIRALFTYPPPKIEVIPKNLHTSGFHDVGIILAKPETNEEEF